MLRGLADTRIFHHFVILVPWHDCLFDDITLGGHHVQHETRLYASDSASESIKDWACLYLAILLE